MWWGRATLIPPTTQGKALYPWCNSQLYVTGVSLVAGISSNPLLSYVSPCTTSCLITSPMKQLQFWPSSVSLLFMLSLLHHLLIAAISKHMSPQAKDTTQHVSCYTYMPIVCNSLLLSVLVWYHFWFDGLWSKILYKQYKEHLLISKFNLLD